jgi:hypothetical protein
MTYFKKTYELINKGPKAMSWNHYEERITKEWSDLLEDVSKSKNEKIYQDFFEENPCLIPGAFGLIGRSGHAPYPGAVISQPQLSGLFKRIPDFMWIANDSGTIYPVFIEIEAPSKRWFLDNGKQSDDFTQAHNQLAEWRQWFSRPNNVNLFLEYFQIPTSLTKGRAIRPLFLLIYGRRSEFEQKPYLNEKRKYLAREDEFFMTYDSLAPDYNARNLLCVKIKDGNFIGISVPPTFTLGPTYADWHSKIVGKEDAVKRNRSITPARKEFLLKRIPYWDAWGKSVEKGIINTRDEE